MRQKDSNVRIGEELRELDPCFVRPWASRGSSRTPWMCTFMHILCPTGENRVGVVICPLMVGKLPSPCSVFCIRLTERKSEEITSLTLWCHFQTSINTALRISLYHYCLSQRHGAILRVGEENGDPWHQPWEQNSSLLICISLTVSKKPRSCVQDHTNDRSKCWWNKFVLISNKCI